MNANCSQPTPHDDGDALVAGDKAYPATRWSLVLAAGGDGSMEAQGALEELCRRYWWPVYATVRGSGAAADEAEDLTQDFFALVLQRDDFAKADPEKGRFRTFLRTAVKRFLIDDWRWEKRQKRDPGAPLIPMDSKWAEAELVKGGGEVATPDQLFDYHWACGLLDRCLDQLQALYVQEGKVAHFSALFPYLDGTEADHRFSEIGRELGISEGGARSAMFRLRNRFRRLVREEVALTVGNDSEIKDEIRQLFAILSR